MFAKQSLLSLGALVVAAGCADAHSKESPPAVEAEVVPIRVVPVAQEDVVRPVHGVGRVRAATEVALSFPFGGVVDDVRVVAGQAVRRGQILAVLDDDAARAQLAAAESGLDKARRDAERATALEGTAVGRQQREDAATGVEVARANVDAAAFQARRQALVAPTDGVIVAVQIDEQAAVGAGMPAILFAGGAHQVELSVASVDAVGLAVGDPATVRVDAWPGVAFGGRVIERAGGAGAFGGWRVTVALDAAPRPLASGLVASVDVTPAASRWTTVPLDALAEADGARGAVYTLRDDSTVRRVEVDVAFVQDGTVAVSRGLEDVGLVVTAGLPWLSEGARVRIVGGAK